MKAALLLIDLQHDFLSLQVEPAREIVVGNAHRVLELARQQRIPVVHIHTAVNAPNQLPDTRMPHWKKAEKWSCVAGTFGHQTPEELRAHNGETIIHKQFFSAWENGELDKFVKQNGIDTLILVGVHTHGCIRATALDAYARQQQVLVIDDAIGSDDALHAAITQRYLEARSIEFVSLETLKSRLLQHEAKPNDAPKLAAAVIDNEKIDAEKLRDWSHVSPRDTSQILFRMSLCDASIIAQATQNAQSAQRLWRDSSMSTRVGLLQRFAHILQGESENLAARMAREIGKPVAQGRAEIARSIALIKTVISFADESLQTRCTPNSVARFRPLGTVAAITPWNNPVAIAIGKIAPALFYGNAVVWKPSPFASHIAHEVMEIWRRTELPRGLINCVDGDRTTAAHLMNNARIDAVTLTGSIAAGYSAQEICAHRHVPLQAELGGNNAAIVWRDCDLENAARQIAIAAFGFAGQRCTANRRAIVETSVYDEFLAHLQTATRALVWGEPCDEATQIGPLISRSSQRESSTRTERARQFSAQIFTPHRAQPDFDDLMQRGAYFPPTIVCCDDVSAEIVQAESFAPILVVQRAAMWDDAISLCNGVRHGLAAALFSASPQLQQRFLDEAQCGILKINSATADANAVAPFGGWKASGVGPAEHGRSNREFYTRAQSVYGAPLSMKN